MSEDELLALLRASLVREGRLLPETAQEIEYVEKELTSEPTTLPDSLQNPDEVLKGTWDGHVEFLPRESDSADENAAARESLARAARQGGEIPPEVEEEMRRQRDSHSESREDESEDEG